MLPITPCWMQRQQKADANVFRRMFKEAIAPKQRKGRGKSKVKGGFATQRAYGIEVSKESQEATKSNGDKPDKDGESQNGGKAGKRPALSGLLSLLNKD